MIHTNIQRMLRKLSIKTLQEHSHLTFSEWFCVSRSCSPPRGSWDILPQNTFGGPYQVSGSSGGGGLSDHPMDSLPTPGYGSRNLGFSKVELYLSKKLKVVYGCVHQRGVGRRGLYGRTSCVTCNLIFSIWIGKHIIFFKSKYLVLSCSNSTADSEYFDNYLTEILQYFTIFDKTLQICKVGFDDTPWTSPNSGPAVLVSPTLDCSWLLTFFSSDYFFLFWLTFHFDSFWLSLHRKYQLNNRPECYLCTSLYYSCVDGVLQLTEHNAS